VNKLLKSILGTSFLLVVALIAINFASCKDQSKPSGETAKAFDVKSIKLWGENIKNKRSCEIAGGGDDKSLEIVVTNVKVYQLSWSINGGDSNTVDATDGTAKKDSITLPVGESTLEITLTAEGMTPYKQTIKVNLELASADVEVKLKRLEDDDFLTIEDSDNQETNATEAEIKVISDKPMKTAKVGTTPLTLSTDKKTATGMVQEGKNTLKVEIEGCKDFEFVFTLTKVTGALKLNATKAFIYSGNKYKNKVELRLEPNKTIYRQVSPKEIEYGVVKLEMEFDAPLRKAEVVRCKDDRAENYTDVQSVEHFYKYGGIFSGRVFKDVKITKQGKKYTTEETELVNIDGNKYTEYLIIGRGKVEYDIQFQANGREPVKYTIKMENKLKLAYTESLAKNVPISLYNAQENTFGIGLGSPYFLWLQYMESPLVPPSSITPEKLAERMSTLEYMGDIIHIKFYCTPNDNMKSSLGNEDMQFFYNIIDEEKDKKCHNFVRVHSVLDKDGDFMVEAAFDPEEKKVDSYLGFQKALPLSQCTTNLAKPFKKVIEKGFILEAYNNDAIRKAFFNTFYYRNQAKIFEKLNTPNGRTDDNAMKIGRDQKYTEFIKGTIQYTNPNLLTGSSNDKTKLRGRDHFFLNKTFKGKFSEVFDKITCEIKRKNSAGDWESLQNEEYELQKWDALPYLIVGAKQGWMDKWTAGTNLGDVDCTDIFCFEKGEDASKNIYKIEITTKLKGKAKEEYFDIILDYQNLQTQKPLSLEGANDTYGSSDLFGLPVNYAPINKNFENEDDFESKFIKP